MVTNHDKKRRRSIRTREHAFVRTGTNMQRALSLPDRTCTQPCGRGRRSLEEQSEDPLRLLITVLKNSFSSFFSVCAPRPAFSALHFKGRKTQALASHLETAWLRTDNAESAPTFCCSRCWRAGTRLALCLGRRARARPSAQKKRTKIQK